MIMLNLFKVGTHDRLRLWSMTLIPFVGGSNITLGGEGPDPKSAQL